MPQIAQVVRDSQQAMSIKFNNIVYELRRRGHHVIVMSLGEAYFDIPLYPMDDLPYPDVNHYSHSRGLRELREKLAGYFLSEYDVPVDVDREIIVTAGSKAAIYMTLMSILNPGDEVLYSEPGWVSYPEQVKLCYGVPLGIPYDQPIGDVERYVTPRTRAIIINNPHNPRGEVFDEATLRHLLDVARRHDLWILSDEAYSDFLIDDAFVSMGRVDREKTHSVVFNSISKNYGISGWRLGYVIGNGSLIDQVLKVNQHLITCPSTILSWYIARHFDRVLDITKPQIRSLVCRRQQLASFMDEIGLRYLPGTATFYYFVSIAPSCLGSEEFSTRLLEDDHVCVVPGIGYGASCDRFVRVSIGTTTMDESRQGLRAIKALIDKTS